MPTLTANRLMQLAATGLAAAAVTAGLAGATAPDATSATIRDARIVNPRPHPELEMHGNPFDQRAPQRPPRSENAWNIIQGTGAHDVLYGTAKRDAIYGLGGATDFLNGRANDDFLSGGPGRDNMHGGADDDYLRGGADGDWLTGGRGVDILRGEGGDDYIDASDNANEVGIVDLIYCGPGSDDRGKRDAEDRFINVQGELTTRTGAGCEDMYVIPN